MYFSRHAYSKEVHMILTNQPPFSLHPAELCLCLPSFPLFFKTLLITTKRKKRSVSWLQINCSTTFLQKKKQKGEGTSKCGMGSVTVVFVSINLRAQESMRYLHKSFHNSCGLWQHCICMTSPLWLVCAFSAALPTTGRNPGYSQQFSVSHPQKQIRQSMLNTSCVNAGVPVLLVQFPRDSTGSFPVHLINAKREKCYTLRKYWPFRS